MIRIKITYFLFLCLFLLIIVKLFYLQFLNQKSSTDYYLKTNKISAERGRIFDINGLPLAVNKTNFLLFVEPKKIKDKDYLIEKIDNVLEMDQASLSALIDMKKNWAAITVIDEQTKNKIKNFNLAGLGFEERTQRYYPEASLAAHLLGFVGKDINGEDVGYVGAEGFYNKELAGMPGVIKTERDLLNRPILIGTQEKVDSEDGRDLYLTIDKTVQEITKTELNNGMERYRAAKGCAIVADPQSMKILALSCLPDFDVEKYYEFSEEHFKNTAISDLFEPGSIFKPLIMAAALEEKKIKPDDIYNETGPIKIAEYQIKTWNEKYEGKISMTRILEKSSNVGMVYIGEKLGANKIYKYLQKYGFGEITGIDLQGEAPGYLKPQKNWYPIDYSVVTFGQGIAATPIQIIRAFASIINGGKLIKPHILGEIANGEKKQEIQLDVVNRVISENTSKIIRKMLLATVENGDSKWAKPAGYLIGGKTGTAQIPIAGHYDPTKTVASFVGFAPYNNPKFIVLVTLREPKTSPWGSETAAPIFFEIAKKLLVYYNIAPGQ